MTTPVTGTLISVIIAAYNAADTIESCVKSILSQSHQNLEVIIANDNSSDDTLQVITKLQQLDHRIQIVNRTENGGPAAARNSALEIAKGEWVAVVDSDDTIDQNRLATLLATAERQGCDIVFDNICWIEPQENGPDLRRPYISPSLPVFGALPLFRYIESHKRNSNVPSLGFLKPFFRRALCTRNNIRYNPSLWVSEDTMFILDLMSHGARAHLTSRADYFYKRRTGSLSHRYNLKNMLTFDQVFSKFMTESEIRLSPAERKALKTIINYNRERIKAKQAMNDVMSGKIFDGIKKAFSGLPVAQLFIREIGSMIKRRSWSINSQA